MNREEYIEWLRYERLVSHDCLIDVPERIYPSREDIFYNLIEIGRMIDPSTISCDRCNKTGGRLNGGSYGRATISYNSTMPEGLEMTELVRTNNGWRVLSLYAYMQGGGQKWIGLYRFHLDKLLDKNKPWLRFMDLDTLGVLSELDCEGIQTFLNVKAPRWVEENLSKHFNLNNPSPREFRMFNIKDWEEIREEC